MSFQITSGKGFAVRFQNGWEISVQFGAINYCSNRGVVHSGGDISSPNAECSVRNPHGEFVPLPEPHDNESAGYISSDEVLALMNWAAVQPASVPRGWGVA